MQSKQNNGKNANPVKMRFARVAMRFTFMCIYLPSLASSNKHLNHLSSNILSDNKSYNPMNYSSMPLKNELLCPQLSKFEMGDWFKLLCVPNFIFK